MEKKIKLSVRNVSKSFPGGDGERIQAVKDISFEIEDIFGQGRRDIGEFRVLLGPSGCGKSTILRMIAGLETPDTGEIDLNGRRIIMPGRDRGMVFQKYTSFPWLTVQENIEYGLKINRVGRKEREEIARRFVKSVKLEGFEGAYPHALSGGMQQRVAIARTLAVNPEVVLMDEPFGALDALTRQDMQVLLLDIWEKSACTVIFVTHDVEEAILLSDRIFILSARPGTIVEDLEVPFPRPRGTEIKERSEFEDLEAHILEKLRRAPGRGQVRVSI
jgi:NitT/TauT family transport system ATP-binding protein